MDAVADAVAKRQGLTVPVTEGVRLPVRLAPLERVAVEDLVGVHGELLVLLEEGVCAPEFVVVMVADIVPELVKEGVEVEELVTVDVAVPVLDAVSEEEPDPVFVEEGVLIPVLNDEPVLLTVVVPDPVFVPVPEPVLVALTVRLLVPLCVDVVVRAAVWDGVGDTVLNALREGLIVDVDE